MATDAQKRANKKYEQTHKLETTKKQAKSRARWFINNADINDLESLNELRKLITAKLEHLKK